MMVDLTPLSHPYRVMHAMAEVYGRVMRVMLGDQEWIVLSGLPEIKQFAMSQQSTFHLESKTFNEMYSFDEPLGNSLSVYVLPTKSEGYFIFSGIIFPDGTLWKDQRKFAVKTLKDLGVGKNSLESCIQQETSEMILHLSELLTTDRVTLRIDDFFDLPCLNVIWSLVNTRRFSYDDKHMKKMIELIDKFTMNNYVGPLGWISF